jgi:hypothetical protein
MVTAVSRSLLHVPEVEHHHGRIERIAKLDVLYLAESTASDRRRFDLCTC